MNLSLRQKIYVAGSVLFLKVLLCGTLDNSSDACFFSSGLDLSLLWADMLFYEATSPKMSCLTSQLPKAVPLPAGGLGQGHNLTEWEEGTRQSCDKTFLKDHMRRFLSTRK